MVIGYHLCTPKILFKTNPIENLQKTQPTFGCFHHILPTKPSYTCCAKSGAVTSSPPLKIRVTAAKVLRHATLPRWPWRVGWRLEEIWRSAPGM